MDFWGAVFNSPGFREGIWKMLQDTHPMRTMDNAPVTNSTAERKLGEIQGYQLAMERLQLCAQFQQPPGEMPTATFEQPKDEE